MLIFWWARIYLGRLWSDWVVKNANINRETGASLSSNNRNKVRPIDLRISDGS